MKVLARYVDRGKWGYVRVRLDDGRIVPEHRFVMERHLGRVLRKDEHVHHRNKNRHDNRVRNLVLTSNEDHGHEHGEERSRATRIRLTCPVCASKFTRTRSYVRSKQASGARRLCCSNRCGRTTSTGS